MDILKILLCLILGFLLSGIYFVLNVVCIILGQKINRAWLNKWNPLLASIIPICIIALTIGIYPIQSSGISNISVYLITIITIIITVLIVTRKREKKYIKGKGIIIYGLDGVLMELPQRLMMQSFVYGLLKIFNVSWLNFYTVLITGLIWCLGISVQVIISKNKFNQDVVIDIIASLVFSIGVGYVYQQTGVIILSMIAHFCERILSCYIYSKQQDSSVESKIMS